MSEWVSCKKRFPSPGEWVVFLSRKKNWKRKYQIFYGVYAFDKWYPFVNILTGEDQISNEVKNTEVYVTHWFPLPILPEVNDG